MPRIVRLTATSPVKIEPTDKPVFVCACGLSQRFPICDGSHKTCKDREPDPSKLYVYDAGRTCVVEVREDAPPQTPGLPSSPQ
jgi:CDGSH iron-sulfur domain-containing protein 1